MPGSKNMANTAIPMLKKAFMNKIRADFRLPRGLKERGRGESFTRQFLKQKSNPLQNVVSLKA